jgi:protein-disulfide isomerase
MRRALPLLIIGAVLLLGLGGGWFLLRWKQQHQYQPSPVSPVPPIEETQPTAQPALTPSSSPESEAAIPATPATSGSPEPIHIRGNKAAKVTLEEYGDFQCQPCGRLYPVLKLLEQSYGDKLRVIFRHMPLTRHEHAMLAARAAEAAGLQGHFWEMHDLLYENALRWTKGVDSVGSDGTATRRLESTVLAMDIEVRDVLFHYAEVLKLDLDRFKQDLDSAPVKARVDSDHTKGVSLGIDRTPTIYVNGNHIPAPSSLTEEGLRAAIDAALAGKVFVPPPTPGATPEPPK